MRRWLQQLKRGAPTPLQLLVPRSAQLYCAPVLGSFTSCDLTSFRTAFASFRGLLSTGVSGWNDVYACSYLFLSFLFDPVTRAKSPRQVINILNYEGGEIDIILAEVDLPVSKCFKLLKYIARNKDLRHIPIISKLCPTVLDVAAAKCQPPCIDHTFVGEILQ
jgi:CheY-like chemotaxis protein